jgi:hypothetical protein
MTTTATRRSSSWAQESTPQAHGPAHVVEALRRGLLAEAIERHAPYPQYAGYFDDWQLIEVTKRVRTKLGVAFETGDVVLGTRPNPVMNLPEHYTCYSRRTGANTAVPVKHARPVLVDDERPTQGGICTDAAVCWGCGRVVAGPDYVYPPDTAKQLAELTSNPDADPEYVYPDPDGCPNGEPTLALRRE